MREGFLWFDNNPKKSLDEKVAEAVERYRLKFGAEPNVCYVNPAHLELAPPVHAKIRVASAKSVLPNHFWLEVEK
jgi:hypothetical protein